MDYIRRVVDGELDELLPGLGAIAVEGPKAVGKTATALRRARTVHRLDDPATLEVLRGDPRRLTHGERPVLVDEWQRLPESWDLVRRAVDDDPTPGQFLLTGSATPRHAPAHSGAGRIVTVRMRPLSLAERARTAPTVSLAALLTGTRPPLTGATPLALADYTEEIVRSGFPAIRRLEGRARRAQLDGYLDRIVHHDLLDEADQRVRNPGALRRWLTAYAAATSTTAGYEVIRDAASPGESDKPARSTTAGYRNALERLWILDEVPAWLPGHNRLRRLAAAPVHQVADPALAARLLGVDTDALLEARPAGPVPRDGSLLGALFQSLVTLSVRVYAQAAEARVSHLRTRGGAQEVDLVVERADGRVVACEVKLARTVEDHDMRHLRWLADRLGDDLLDAVVISTGPEAYRRADGIGVVPAALLGP